MPQPEFRPLPEGVEELVAKLRTELNDSEFKKREVAADVQHSIYDPQPGVLEILEKINKLVKTEITAKVKQTYPGVQFGTQTDIVRLERGGLYGMPRMLSVVVPLVRQSTNEDQVMFTTKDKKQKWPMRWQTGMFIMDDEACITVDGSALDFFLLRIKPNDYH